MTTGNVDKLTGGKPATDAQTVGDRVRQIIGDTDPELPWSLVTGVSRCTGCPARRWAKRSSWASCSAGR